MTRQSLSVQTGMVARTIRRYRQSSRRDGETLRHGDLADVNPIESIVMTRRTLQQQARIGILGCHSPNRWPPAGDGKLRRVLSSLIRRGHRNVASRGDHSKALIASRDWRLSLWV